MVKVKVARVWWIPASILCIYMQLVRQLSNSAPIYHTIIAVRYCTKQKAWHCMFNPYFALRMYNKICKEHRNVYSFPNPHHICAHTHERMQSALSVSSLATLEFKIEDDMRWWTPQLPAIFPSMVICRGQGSAGDFQKEPVTHALDIHLWNELVPVVCWQ